MADTSFARAEREALCDLFLTLGPDQPTLCAGWLTRDLAAHLLLRERRPDAALGIAVSPLAGHTQRVQQRIASGDFHAIVEGVRRPPRWSPLRLGPIDEAANTMEFFIHHEDARRGQPQWRPRELAPELERMLWSRVRALARRLRRFGAEVTVEAPGHGTVDTGGSDSGERVRLRGAPGELLLFLSGRQAAAQVEIDGSEPLRERLRTAKLAM